MDDWISVDDRLPEHNGEYLVYYFDNGNNTFIRIKRFKKKGVEFPLMYSDKNECIYWSGQSPYDNIITHWMPLPLPPKGETE